MHAVVADDLRAVIDARRLEVIKQICWTPFELGWSLTITTKPFTKSGILPHNDDGERDTYRTGQTMDLVMDVLSMILPNGYRVSRETVAKDICIARESILRVHSHETLGG